MLTITLPLMGLVFYLGFKIIQDSKLARVFLSDGLDSFQIVKTKIKNGVITIGENSWIVSNIQPKTLKTNFGTRPIYRLDTTHTEPLEFDTKTESSNNWSPKLYKKFGTSKFFDVMLSKKKGDEPDYVLLGGAMIGGMGLMYFLMTSGVLKSIIPS